ncbi:MAG: MFS transporter [Deltaproteobacteria bacterium]|nr:MFS transporter [Deltaproteobacteria bacterium]MBI4796953.1 MFS transporter [Deltaproteobacteria bacterium]
MLPFFIAAYSVISSSLYFFLPLYLKDGLNFSGSQIGLLYGVLSLNAILVSFPVGVTADRYPARILTRLGLLATALCLWILSGVGRFWPFLLIFWGFGLSLQLFRQSLDILLFKENRPDISRVFGEYNAWRMGGMMLGALVGGMLLYSLDFPLTLKLLALGVLALLFPTARLPRSPGVRSPLLQYGRDFLTRPVLFFAAWLFLFTLHWGAEATSLALFLKNNLSLSPRGIGFYMAGEFAVVGLTAYAYGRFWAGRVKPLHFLSLALLTSGAGHIMMTYPSLSWSFFWRAVHGFGDGLILMEAYTTIARLFHVDRIGGNSSLISLITTLGVFAGSLMFGPLGAHYGYAWPLIISGAISLALLPLAYAGLREG